MVDVIAGIFIGGGATRFGGIAKGLLEAPDGTGKVIQRLVNLLRELHVPSVFVASRADHPYEMVGLPTILDRSEGVEKLGPLGGFLALYEHALRAGSGRVVALACDMPFVTRATLERLVGCEAPVAAARRDGRWEPFLSVHDARIMRPRAEANAAAGRRALQALFDGAAELPVDAHELEDWDSPEDVARTIPIRTMS